MVVPLGKSPCLWQAFSESEGSRSNLIGGTSKQPVNGWVGKGSPSEDAFRRGYLGRTWRVDSPKHNRSKERFPGSRPEKSPEFVKNNAFGRIEPLRVFIFVDETDLLRSSSK